MQLCQGEARRPVIYLACDRWNVSRFGDRTMIREDCVAGARDGGRELRGGRSPINTWGRNAGEIIHKTSAAEPSSKFLNTFHKSSAMASSQKNVVIAKVAKFLKRRLSLVLAKRRYEELSCKSHTEESIENELNEALEAQLLQILSGSKVEAVIKMDAAQQHQLIKI